MVTIEFIPIVSKNFITLDLDADDLAGDVVKVDGEDGQPVVNPGDIVRVRYAPTQEQAQMIDTNHLAAALLAAGASRYALKPEPIRTERARVTTVNEQLSQTEALAAWCDANEIDTVMRGRMIERLGAWT